MKWLVMIVLVGAIGGGFWVHQHHGEARRLEEQARRDLDYAEIKATQARIDLLNKYLDTCKRHNAPDKLDGAYDGFSYSKESDYVRQKDEQEQRYKDLQGRFDSAYGK